MQVGQHFKTWIIQMKRNVKTKLNIHIHTYLLIEIEEKRETMR